MPALGPFELNRPVARGGSATVWRAQHRRRAVPVAVKILLGGEERAAQWRARLAAEVQAIARLNHRGVVRLHDQDRIPPAVADATGLPAGAPYLVMEWIGGGTLRDARPVGWAALRATLLDLLDALAHAHAHGVVHRDLKPDNVLLAERGPVLSDFGLALPAEATPEGGLSGTPGYMPPEQIRAEWWRYGPWTDLYALGCLAWERLCGQTPFGAVARRSPWSLLDAHLDGRLPPLRPRMAVPAGVEGWLATLLHPEPGGRFAFAADAAAALRGLGPAPTTGTAGVGDPRQTTPTLVGESAPLAFATTVSTPARAGAPSARPASSPAPTPRPAPPPAWRSAEPPEPPPPLDVGRALGRLRTPPPVGRAAERDALWRALLRAVAGEPQLVLIEGPAGVGKRHLAGWIARKAHALGLAEGLLAHHEPGPDSGPGPMFARRFRCRDAADDRRARIAAAVALEPELLDAAAAVLDGQGDPDERRGVFAGLVAALCARRPQVLRIEDGQRAVEARALVRAIRARRLPVLVVVTLRDDAPGEVAAEDWAADVRLRPGPLPADAMARLVRGVLPLEVALVEQVIERAAGSPLFAVELVRQWGELVEPGPRGFRPRPNTTLPMPAGLSAVWRARLDRALPGDAPALELAAVLGVVVEPAELGLACAAAGLSPPGPPVDLIEQRLAVLIQHRRWAFAHPMLREAFVERARAAGRLARWHACAAEAVPESAALRRAQHLVAAGRPAAAWAPLMAAARRAVLTAEAGTLRRILARAVALHRRLGRGAAHPGWAEIGVRALVLAVLEGRYAPTLRRAPRALRRARATGRIGLTIEALLINGGALHANGRPEPARVTYADALRLAEAHGDPYLVARAASRVGWLDAERGATTDAEALLRRSVQALDGLDDHQARVLRANALRNLADLGRRLERPEALALAERAIAAYRAAGLRRPVAQMQVIVGDLLRYRGQLDAAAEAYRAAADAMRAIDAPEQPFADMNRAMVLRALDRPGEARRILAGVIAADPGAGAGAIAAMIARAVILPCDALAGDWAAWDGRFAGLGAVGSGRLSDPDIAESARAAAALAEARGEPRRAARARALAATQFEALGRPDEAAEMRAATAAPDQKETPQVMRPDEP